MRFRSSPDTLSVGLLAGGQGTRLGGVDKAWLRRGVESQIVWLLDQLQAYQPRILVSANTYTERYRALGFPAVADQTPGLGPLAGISAIAQVCSTPWLLTLPVDVVDVVPGLTAFMGAVEEIGGVAEDDDGLQPLVALWRIDALGPAVAEALADRRLAVRDLQARLGMPVLRLPGVRFGNLNTPDDLARAGLDTPTRSDA